MSPNFSNEFFSGHPLSPPKFTNHHFMSLQRPTGKRKQLIAKVGIACTTALRRTSLLACDNNFSFHPWIFPHTLSLMKFRLVLLFLPTTVGRPKYFSYSLISGTPRKIFMSFFVVMFTTLLKKRVVVSLLIHCSEAFSYRSKIPWMALISLI